MLWRPPAVAIRLRTHRSVSETVRRLRCQRHSPLCRARNHLRIRDGAVPIQPLGHRLGEVERRHGGAALLADPLRLRERRRREAGRYGGRGTGLAGTLFGTPHCDAACGGLASLRTPQE